MNDQIKAALAVSVGTTDAGPKVKTVRDYLRKLLETVWEEGECFSGKRPFGNSGWDADVIWPLARAGFVNLGKPDEDGDFNYTDAQEAKARKFVSECIRAMCAEPQP
ncbi:MAG: hypothetical protein WC273_10615 [Dehalococcoidia bacterium]